jgi:hypothetical protein
MLLFEERPRLVYGGSMGDEFGVRDIDGRPTKGFFRSNSLLNLLLSFERGNPAQPSPGPRDRDVVRERTATEEMPLHEAEWLTGTDPDLMLRFLQGKISDRKLRLFACACARAAWHPLPNAASRTLLEIAESFADGTARTTDVQNARRRGYCMGLIWILADDAKQAARSWTHSADPPTPAAASSLIRDICGNPFRPVPATRQSLGSSVQHLATSIYGKTSFDRLPLLADALEDAGCTDAELLSHLRSPGPHVRGCWAVDLVLGKE